MLDLCLGLRSDLRLGLLLDLVFALGLVLCLGLGQWLEFELKLDLVLRIMTA